MYSGDFFFVGAVSVASGRLAADDELAAAAVRDPDALVVVAPGLAEEAGRFARGLREDHALDVSAGQCCRSPGFDAQVTVDRLGAGAPTG